MLSVLCLLGSFNVAVAHEFIVKPGKLEASRGEPVDVQVQAAHVFMVSEEAEAVEDVELDVRQSGMAEPVALSVAAPGTYLHGIVSLAEEGPALFAARRLPQIWSDTTEGVLAGDRAVLEAQGKKVLAVGRYEKFAKTLINATPADTLYKEVLGQPLEIVLLDNPARLKPGDSIRCRVLYAGRPIVTTVGAVYDGYSGEEDVYVSKTETGADGEALIKITAPGLWMLRANFSGTIKDSGSGEDKFDLRATYVFGVK